MIYFACGLALGFAWLWFVTERGRRAALERARKAEADGCLPCPECAGWRSELEQSAAVERSLWQIIASKDDELAAAAQRIEDLTVSAEKFRESINGQVANLKAERDAWKAKADECGAKLEDAMAERGEGWDAYHVSLAAISLAHETIHAKKPKL